MPDNTYVIQEANSETAVFQDKLPYVTFDSSGKLKDLNNGKGNRTTVVFNTGSVVITDPSGRTATLSRNADGTVSQITTSAYALAAQPDVAVTEAIIRPSCR